MPWELGYFDGLKKSMVAVLPIVSEDADKSIQGSEYVGLYYVVDFAFMPGTQQKVLWVNDGPKSVTFRSWLNGIKPNNH